MNVSVKVLKLCKFFSGDVHEEKIRFDEEGVRTVGAVWLRNRTNNIQLDE